MKAIALPALLSMSIRPLKKALINLQLMDAEHDLAVIDLQVEELYAERRNRVRRQIQLIEKRNALEQRQ